MKNINAGSIFFFIFIFFMLSNLLPNIGFFFPFLIFFFIANGMSKANNKNKSRGHVRESTRRRRTAAQERQRRTQYPRTRTTTTRPTKSAIPKKNPFKKSGKDKFQDFDYDGAIEDFTKALQIDSRDPATHFNLACAYSLTEQKELAFEALSKAFALGFNDIEKVKTHDALAFLRVQDEFEQFVAGKFRWPMAGNTAPKSNPEQNSELLQQLKQLADLREKGLLTDEEFLMQKKRLLR